MKFGKQPAPVADINEDDLEVHKPKTEAAGVKAVMVALERAVAQAGVTRTAQSLLRLNQRGGFDCPGCAWPESDKKRKAAEFCENGAKAVAEENTLRTVGAEFWAKHSIAELAEKTEYWLGNQGRLSEPVVIREGETHYAPISWADAFGLVGEHIRASTPDRCVFYTSGPHGQRDRVHVPAVRPVAGHQQPAGLLQHVPRVLRFRAQPDHRHRQGHGIAG
jgi:formate dehydrogenase major subunit